MEPNWETLELAWAAGFYDGEGCTGTFLMHPRRPRSYLCLRVVVTQAERSTLERFHAAVGHRGNIVGPITKNRGGRKPLFRLNVNGLEAVEVLRLLWPWLSEPKREQAERCVFAFGEDFARRRMPHGNQHRRADPLTLSY